ncbi:MAG: hypothetical protein P4L83_14080 [Nevskia sp.]|nr:hypothetical protein [Nevskia sp.]
MPVKALMLACAATLAACATEPMGPTVQVLPGRNKPFDAFQNDQAVCEQYASQQVAGQADAANQRGLGEAVLTTALGAGLGAAIGGGQGAGVGAAAGSLVGANVGAGTSTQAGGSIQHQYDMAYTQCMYSKGNQLPQPARPVYVTPPPVYYPAPVYAPPPPVYYPAPAYPAYPPPPPGYGPP